MALEVIFSDQVKEFVFSRVVFGRNCKRNVYVF